MNRLFTVILSGVGLGTSEVANNVLESVYNPADIVKILTQLTILVTTIYGIIKQSGKGKRQAKRRHNEKKI